MLKFYGHLGVPQDVRKSLQRLLDSRNLLSPQLRGMIDFFNDNEKCHLFVDVLDYGNDAHGDTGTYVSPLKAPKGTLVQEAFLSKPALIVGPHESFIKVTVEAGTDSSPAEASTTFLHELELHAVPAGVLLRSIAQLADDDDARLGLVLDHMRRADDHIDLDRQEQYVRAAARIRQANANTGLKTWSADLLRTVAKDALEQFTAYELKKVRDDSPARVEWLASVIEAIEANGPAATTTKIKPQPNQVIAEVDETGELDLSGYLAMSVFKRRDMLDIVDKARVAFEVSVSQVLNRYCTQIVPALLTQVPGELTDVVQQMVFLQYHGVPDLVALDAIENSGSTPPQVEVVSAWPPDMPVFWLTETERETWSPLTGLPKSIREADDLEHGKLLMLNGRLYRAAVKDSLPEEPFKTTKFFRHPLTGKFVALIKK